MCKDCFHCMHGQCLELETNTVPCKLFGKSVPNNDAEECDAFTAHVELDSSDVEVITEFQVHHKCPYCGYEDTIYDASGEDTQLVTCEKCGKEYELYWCIY